MQSNRNESRMLTGSDINQKQADGDFNSAFTSAIHVAAYPEGCLMTRQPLTKHVREMIAVALKEMIAGAAEIVSKVLHYLLYLLWGSMGFSHHDALSKDNYMQKDSVKIQECLSSGMQLLRKHVGANHLVRGHLWDLWQTPQICLSHDLCFETDQ